jgi:hypothetical protein
VLWVKRQIPVDYADFGLKYHRIESLLDSGTDSDPYLLIGTLRELMSRLAADGFLYDVRHAGRLQDSAFRREIENQLHVYAEKWRRSELRTAEEKRRLKRLATWLDQLSIEIAPRAPWWKFW